MQGSVSVNIQHYALNCRLPCAEKKRKLFSLNCENLWELFEPRVSTIFHHRLKPFVDIFHLDNFSHFPRNSRTQFLGQAFPEDSKKLHNKILHNRQSQSLNFHQISDASTKLFQPTLNGFELMESCWQRIFSSNWKPPVVYRIAFLLRFQLGPIQLFFQQIQTFVDIVRFWSYFACLLYFVFFYFWLFLFYTFDFPKRRNSTVPKYITANDY